MASAYELLEAYVNITERGSAGIFAALAKIEEAVARATAGTRVINVDTNIPSASRDTRAMLEALEGTRREAEHVRSVLSSWQPPVQSSTAQLTKSVSLLRSMSAGASSVAASLNSQAASVVQMAASIGKAAAAYAALRGAAAIARTAISEVADRESDRVSLELLAGSAERARDVLAGIKALADESPFSFPELRESAARMIAMGTASEVVVDRLQRLATISSATSANINSVIRQYSQAQGVGTLRAEDLIVLEENNFPAYKLLNDLTGRSVGELRKLGEQGRLSFSLLEEAIVKATDEGGKFFGTMERGAATMKGNWEAITDATRNIAGNLGEWSIFDVSQDLKGLRFLLQDIEKASKATANAIGEAPSTFDEKARDATRFRAIDLFTAGVTPVLRLFAVIKENQAELDKLADSAVNAKQKIDDAANSAGNAAAGSGANSLDKAEAIRTITDSLVEQGKQSAKAYEQAQRAFDDMIESQTRSAESLRRSLLSPIEQFDEEIRRVGELFLGGFINRPLFDKAFEKARSDLAAMERSVETITSKNNGFRAGTTQAFTFRLEATRQQDLLLSEQRRGVDVQKRGNEILGEIKKGIDQIVKKPSSDVALADSELF